MKEDYVVQVNLYITDVLSHEINNSDVILLYYKIGCYLSKCHLQSHELKILEHKLQNIYGIIIGFTARNFHSMIHFSQIYSANDLKILTQISWNTHLQILKERDESKRKKLLSFYANSPKKNNYMLTELRMLQQKL